eukprot:6202067-Pleurochrysis_carterae.AAC.2
MVLVSPIIAVLFASTAPQIWTLVNSVFMISAAHRARMGTVQHVDEDMAQMLGWRAKWASRATLPV